MPLPPASTVRPPASRGGGWVLTENNLRSSSRLLLVPAVERINIGFRVASVPGTFDSSVGVDGRRSLATQETLAPFPLIFSSLSWGGVPPREELPKALATWYDYTKWVLDRVDGFPKNQRFVLGTRLADGVVDVMELLAEAAYARGVNTLPRVTHHWVPRLTSVKV